MRGIPPWSSIKIEPASWYPPGEGWRWFDWSVKLQKGTASGRASSFKRAQKAARKALRQIERDQADPSPSTPETES